MNTLREFISAYLKNIIILIGRYRYIKDKITFY